MRGGGFFHRDLKTDVLTSISLISVVWASILTDRERAFDESDNFFQFFGFEDEKASLVNHFVLEKRRLPDELGKFDQTWSFFDESLLNVSNTHQLLGL